MQFSIDIYLFTMFEEVIEFYLEKKCNCTLHNYECIYKKVIV